MSNFRFKALIGVVVLFVAVPGWYFLGGEKQTDSAVTDCQGKYAKISIGTYPGDLAGLLWVAKDLDYFSKYCLDVRMEIYPASSGAIDDVLAGKLDFAAASDFAFVFNNLNGRELMTFVSIASDESSLRVIAKKASGIYAPADLKGKKIGFLPNTRAEFGLGEFLAPYGMNFFDIIPRTYKEPFALEEAISENQVDAVVIWQPFVNRIEALLQEKASSWSVRSKHQNYFQLLATREVVSARKQDIARMLSALSEAERYFAERPSAARSLLLRRLPYYNASLLEDIWPAKTFQLSLSLDMLYLFNDEAKWALAHGKYQSSEVPDFSELIYKDALKAVKPEAVTMP
ncbi:hypothetical protein A3G55_00815 [Candidatus Giovannonibacteria bacterium RIFCSPLOWO2_12_FULL_44_25]|uniref:SsuA/THI5-like domain-containing protein n=3 Tax=Candidatus Giovannoniibacteriota TaxID=1752738 RepID=A0A1F5WAV3_9BACT|nr:MAG: NMT1/THI5 like protein domain protein [Parcubacteria group bacterium GW2011_GWC1_44_10]KKT60309.1 MAG: NMT1/THI5 like protein domain protein [Candidatus Giovannonibacteria bacterium GW2011_GWA1_44_25]KKT83126.1 MAG: NMT1/THI5 like protein domain protein [Candidatus Giovannonibacteria bacterium GW2011_GWC2_44_9]KKU29663.1 MAG: NMT1/THI5 like protein domain protein [Candidatus Giovannonibacteria bacterium GW2011_GWB1_46_20]OGF48966.1 MAG: hypothetical protein A2120_00515 [Candidatus Giova